MAKIHYHKTNGQMPKGYLIKSIVGDNDVNKELLQQQSKINKEQGKTRIKSKEIKVFGQSEESKNIR